MRARQILLAALVVGIVAWLLFPYVERSAPTLATKSSESDKTIPVAQDTLARSPVIAAPSQQATPYPDAFAALKGEKSFPQEHEPVLALKFVGPDSVRVGDVFVVDVAANAYTPVANYKFVLRFNPATLKSIAASPGNFMEQGSAFAKFTENAATSNGEILIASEEDGGAGVEGSGSLVAVQFQAIAAGSTQIKLTSVEALAGSGQPVTNKTPEPHLVVVTN